MAARFRDSRNHASLLSELPCVYVGLAIVCNELFMLRPGFAGVG